LAPAASMVSLEFKD